MLRTAVTRISWSIVILLTLATVTFFLTHVVPADPSAYLAGQNAGTAQVEAVRHSLGLDKPLMVQYSNYMKGLVQGNLGDSIRTHRAVALDVRDALPASLELIFYGFVLYLMLSFFLGVSAALRRSGPIDVLIRGFTTISTAVPVFWLALVFQIVFYGHLGWFPLSGRLTLGTPPPSTVTGFYTIDSLIAGKPSLFVDAVRHLVLPSAAVAMSLLAVGTRVVRVSFIEQLKQDYVRTAKAKGLGPGRILARHVFRNVINSVITITGIQLGYTVGFIILVEVVFDWPGIGLYAFASFDAFDYAAVVGVTLVTGAAFVLINLISDIIYPMFDPRLRT